MLVPHTNDRAGVILGVVTADGLRGALRVPNARELLLEGFEQMLEEIVLILRDDDRTPDVVAIPEDEHQHAERPVSLI
jgi:hypothetical protein